MIFSLHLLLAGGTAFAFAGVMHLEFVRYDDDHMIFENQRVTGGLTREGLRLAWTGPHMGNWHPLTTLSHLIDCQLFGVERPGWHHLVSLCLHVGSVLLLFDAFRRMTGEVWPSALVAALFAVHPLRVESVAWAAERKDVLSGFFWMLTLLAYVWYARNPGIMKYLFCSLALCCALLSKPTTITLPFVLLLVDWWPLRRWRWKQKTEHHREWEVRFPEQSLSRLVSEKIPFLVAAVAAGGFAALVQSHDVVDHPTLAQLPMSWRLVNASMAYVIYLWKSVWPVNLAVLYPHPGLANGANLASCVLPALGGGLLLLAITVWAFFVGPRRPYLLVGWLWYLGTLVPMIGLFQVGWQGYADRYTYWPMIGIYVAISWGARDLVHHWPKAKYPVALLATVWLLALMVLTGRQVGYWRSSQMLFEHALEATADNPIMHNSYGNALDRLGQLDKAIEHYRKAVELKPDYVMAHYNLGSSLSEVGDYDGAVAELRKASQLDPKAVAPHNNLGSALLKQGQTEQAIQEYREAVRLKPDFSASRYNLANALQRAGQDEEAIVHYRESIRLMSAADEAENALLERSSPPGQLLAANTNTRKLRLLSFQRAEAHYNLGIALSRLNRIDEAIENFQGALRLNPRLAEAYNDLGNALFGTGRTEEAIKQYQLALQLEPRTAVPWNNLGNALQRLGRYDEAIPHYRQALQLNPQYADAHNGLGVALLNHGQARQAAEQFRAVLVIHPDSAAARANLRRAEQLLKELPESEKDQRK